MSLRMAFADPALPVSNGLLTNRLQCAVLKIEGDCLEQPALDVAALLRLWPESWQIHISGAVAWPWPQAVEAGMAMYSSALDIKAHGMPKTAFLSEQDWQYARETALLFRKSLANAAQNEI